MSKLPPRGERLNIGLFGRRNVGKSSLLNALCDQDVSIVSEQAGTTTDAVSKIYELIPVGPVTFFDTAGIDDKGDIGELRIAATRKILNKVDIALLVTDEGIKNEETTLISSFNALKIPFIIVFNKCDRQENKKEETLPYPCVSVSAKNNKNIEELKTLIKEIIPEHLKVSPALVSDLIKPYETVICVTPIDTSAPKGRLILPQVQVIRDILDTNAYAYTIQNEQDFLKVLDNLKTPPSLVITDSQLIKEVAGAVPERIRLTTFSTVFARYKADLQTLYNGAKHLATLEDGDKILIAEACSHHVQEDDIARVKMPALIKKVTKKDVHFDWAAGINFPDNLKDYKLVIHCGGCMLSRLETLRRINECTREGVPVTNFGITLSFLQGVLPRVIAPFGLK